MGACKLEARRPILPLTIFSMDRVAQLASAPIREAVQWEFGHGHSNDKADPDADEA